MFNFPAEERLKKNELREVFRGGRRYKHGFLTLIVLRKEAGPNKAGFVIRKSTHSAVERNRCKRILRELYRTNKHRLQGHFWIIVILTKREEKPEMAQVESFFVSVCKKAGILGCDLSR